jgi:hypothetical protein
MSTFYNISAAEMSLFLVPQGFGTISIPGTVEIVFGKRVDLPIPGTDKKIPLTLRVFTGINPSGESRDVGEDAIRVRLFVRNSEGKILELSGSKRVHRVVNWKQNLQKRLDGWKDYVQDTCDRCGMPMQHRRGKNGPFLGCTDYPKCNHTKSIAKE